MPAGTGPLMISCVAPRAAAEALAAAWDDLAGAVSAFEISPGGDWRIEAYGVDQADLPSLHASIAVLAAANGALALEPAIGPMPKVDWLAQSLASFKPFRVGRFYIRPSHDKARQPSSAHVVTVDASIAFGTGEHATTRGCLIVLDRLARTMRPRAILDMGTGTGILAMAMARQWRCAVHAVDIDADSVAVARENARDNGLANLVRPVNGRSFSQRAVVGPGPYDLVVANILARPLMSLAPGIAAHTRPGGRVVLSGLLASQQAMVIAAYRLQGLRLLRRLVIDGWATLLLAR